MNGRVVLRVVLVAFILFAPVMVSAQVSVEEQAEIDANAGMTGGSTVIGDPIPHPGAWDNPEAIIYFSDFDSDNGGLAPTLDWEWGTAYSWVGGACDGGTPPATPYSGVGMWGTILNDCHNNLSNNTGYDTCVNGNTADDSILTLTVDLTGYTDAQLSWWEWPDIFLNWDWGEVYVNGTVVFQHCGTGYVAPGAWVQQVVDLTAYVGAPVTIEFHMMSSGVVAYSGWYIDDFEVQGTPVPVELQSFSID